MCMQTPPTMCESGVLRVGGDFDEELLQDTVDIMRARVEGIVRPIVSLLLSSDNIS